MTYRVQFGADYTHSTGFMQSFPSYQLNNGLGVASRQSNDILNLTVTNTLNYRFDVRHDHHFNVMVGQEGVDYQAEGFNVTTRGQNNDFLTNVTSGTRASSWQDNTTAYSFLSFFGRAEYNYDDRYYVELGLRTDASSRFGKDHRWGKFWSVGLMWNAKKERFLQNTTGCTMHKYRSVQVRQVILKFQTSTIWHWPAVAGFTWMRPVSLHNRKEMKIKLGDNLDHKLRISFGILRAFQCRFGTLPQAYQ